MFREMQSAGPCRSPASSQGCAERCQRQNSTFWWRGGPCRTWLKTTSVLFSLLFLFSVPMVEGTKKNSPGAMPTGARKRNTIRHAVVLPMTLVQCWFPRQQYLTFLFLPPCIISLLRWKHSCSRRRVMSRRGVVLPYPAVRFLARILNLVGPCWFNPPPHRQLLTK